MAVLTARVRIFGWQFYGGAGEDVRIFGWQFYGGGGGYEDI